MLASSAFVLAALTMTGVYMKGQNVESKDDGYTLDFTALENHWIRKSSSKLWKKAMSRFASRYRWSSIGSR